MGANWHAAAGMTPHMDQLAAEGIRFTDFHVGASVCTVSRAALLTGRLGVRTGVVENFHIDSVAGLPRTEKTIAEALNPAGYRTAAIGKVKGSSPVVLLLLDLAELSVARVLLLRSGTSGQPQATTRRTAASTSTSASPTPWIWAAPLLVGKTRARAANAVAATSSLPRTSGS